MGRMRSLGSVIVQHYMESKTRMPKPEWRINEPMPECPNVSVIRSDCRVGTRHWVIESFGHSFGIRVSGFGIPLSVLPGPQHQMMRQVELQRRDGDVSVTQGRHVGVIFGVAEGEDAAVPVVLSAARIDALFIGVHPRARALA